MSSAVLADKHVDSFGPKLLNEARRGTVCSLSHPVAACFSSSPSSLSREGTGISDSPYLGSPELFRKEGKRFLHGLPSLFLILILDEHLLLMQGAGHRGPGKEELTVTRNVTVFTKASYFVICSE